MKCAGLVCLVVGLGLLSGCASTRKGVWTRQSGGEAAVVAKENDAGALKTSWGTVQVHPEHADSKFFHVVLTLKNTSDKDVSFKSEQFQIVSASGHVYGLVSDPENLNKKALDTGLNAGMNGLSVQNVSAMGANMFRRVASSRPVMEGTVKAGQETKLELLLDKSASTGDFSFRVAKEIGGTDEMIRFTTQK